MAPYVQDNWQVNGKLTLNLGFRYDYLQPYHEVHDRLAFLNVNVKNPIVGIPGVLEYAGFPNSSTPAAYAPYLCHCTTPVHPYNKNFEPRLGFAYAYTPTTVFSGGFERNRQLRRIFSDHQL
jgi:outer membrane receptor protein involved in Fe transport